MTSEMKDLRYVREGDTEAVHPRQQEYWAMEAQCARLEKALRQIADGRSGNNVFGDMVVLQRVARAALSDTAQPETAPQPMTLCDSGGGSALFAKIAECNQAEMRERAAKLIRSMEPNGFDPRRFVDQVADAVESLPIDTAQEGECIG